MHVRRNVISLPADIYIIMQVTSLQHVHVLSTRALRVCVQYKAEF